MRGGFVSSFSVPAAGITRRVAPNCGELQLVSPCVGVANVLPQ